MIRYYKNYKNSLDGFKSFHNQVINMPRSDFSTVGYERLQLLAEYLMFFDKNKGKQKYYNYKQIYSFLLDSFKKGVLSIDQDFENNYFAPYINKSLADAYGDFGIGRMFRHEMGIASFFGLIESESKFKKRVNISTCEQFIITPLNLLDDLKRNIILSIRIKDNPYIKEIRGIKENLNTDYKPSYAILNYINEIGRSATNFELSILLGRVDELNNPEDILNRGIEIGKNLPADRSSQINYFFNKMGWINADGSVFTYKPSQEPYFKFKVFLLYMTDFGLLNEANDMYTLTEYSKNLINQDIEPYLIDLDNLLENIEDFEHSNKIIDAVLNSSTLTLEHLLATEEDLIFRLGRRSIDEKIAAKLYGKSSSVKRNRLIMFFAKHLEKHTCLITTRFTNEGPKMDYNIATFETNNGKYYSEGHHILELSEDDGPDVIENIILVDPNTHKLIHHGTPSVVKSFYKTLRKEKVLTIDRFDNMIQRYNCLDRTHVDKLYDRGVIDSDGRTYLITQINQSITLTNN